MSALPDDDTPLARALAEVQRLRAENRRLAEWLEVAQDFGRLGLWERDAATLEGRWDPHVFRLFGFDAATDTAPSFAEAGARVEPGDSLEAVFKTSLTRPGAYEGRFRIRQNDGSVRHVHSQWRVIAGPDGRIERVVGVHLDDTEMHRLADEARAVHAQLALVLALGGIGTWRHDLARGMVHADANAQAVLGWREDKAGTPIDTVLSRIHPDDLARNQADFERALAGAAPVDSTLRYRHADGHWMPIHTRRVVQKDAQGRPVAMVGVGLDMSEQEHSQAETLRLSRWLESATEAARVGLWATPLDGSAAQWNALMYELLDCERSGNGDPTPSLGDLLRERCLEADRERTAREILGWLHGPADAPLHTEFRIRLRSGGMRWLQLRGRHAAAGDGTRRAYGVLQDVSSEREILLRLRDAHERLALTVSSVGIGTWQYDVRTDQAQWDEQMFRLRGLAPRERAPDDAERMALVHPDDRARVATNATAFIASTAPIALEFRIVWPDGSVHWMASRSLAFSDSAGRVVRRIGVNWDVTEARMLADAQRERENALRDSRAKSAFLARVSHELRTPLNAVLGFTQLLLLERPGQREDPAQRRAWLQQIEQAGRTLLGLIDDLLELSGQRGTDTLANTAAAAPGRCVLYIEDNEVNMLIVRELIGQRADLAFHGATSGSSGVEMALSLQPALVLVDMQLPDFDGFEVLRRLRAHAVGEGLRCVALSANAMPEDIARARAAGFDDYWTKPLDLAAFSAALARWLPPVPAASQGSGPGGR